MAFAFPAFHSERGATYSPEADLRQAARETMIALGWSVKQETESQLIATTPVNMLSWGETVTLSFLPTTIEVTSKCSIPTQCVDWGKNKKNVTRFFEDFSGRASRWKVNGERIQS